MRKISNIDYFVDLRNDLKFNFGLKGPRRSDYLNDQRFSVTIKIDNGKYGETYGSFLLPNFLGELSFTDWLTLVHDKFTYAYNYRKVCYNHKICPMTDPSKIFEDIDSQWQ